MKTIKIEGSLRKDLGKSATKEVRRAGNIPAVIYGVDTIVHFAAPALAFRDLIYTGDFHKVDISVDGKNYEAILKEVQFHPVTDKVIHVDFQLLVEGRKLITHIPVRLKGIPVGVKTGGKLITKLRKVKVKAVPADLVDELTIDVTPLKLGKSIKVASIDAGNLEILNSPTIPVASVEIPRALRSSQSKQAQADEADTEEGTEEVASGEEEAKAAE
ncbi:MAG: 50S ribosomal protein L25/general stress protein Ctc [Chitinophagaceae bacterium]|nr:MAG: 50S ribosomal protein L25/general stress protein Ctc [Chitinophagaceae bacterium]